MYSSDRIAGAARHFHDGDGRIQIEKVLGVHRDLGNAFHRLGARQPLASRMVFFK